MKTYESTKERRSNIRIPLISEKLFISVEGDEKEVFMYDITENGVFIKMEKDFYPIKSSVCCMFNLPGELGTFIINGKVKRIQWHKKDNKHPTGFVVYFNELTQAESKIFSSYISYLRNKQIITISKRLVDELFGYGILKKDT